jgi:lysophospholipase L1-like esterase
MNGRTTVFDDPQKGCRNGLKGLDYELQTHKPLDLFVVMLGTNDLKYTDAQGTAKGMERLIALVLNANERYNLSSPVFPEGPRILLISPILLKAHVGGRENDIADAAQLAGLYESIAAAHSLAFLDAAQYTEPSDIDGVHLGVEGHRILGETIAKKIKSLALTQAL